MASGGPEDNSAPLPPHPQQASLLHQAPSPIPNGSINPQQQPPAQPTVPSAGKARLQCHACQRLLEYDAGAQYVQCFSCSTMNAVQPNTQVGGQVLSMLCAICHTTNLAPYGINYVRCGSCSTISQVSHAYRQDRLMSPQAQPLHQPQAPPATAPQQQPGLPMPPLQQQQQPLGGPDPTMMGPPSDVRSMSTATGAQNPADREAGADQRQFQPKESGMTQPTSYGDGSSKMGQAM